MCPTDEQSVTGSTGKIYMKLLLPQLKDSPLGEKGNAEHRDHCLIKIKQVT